MNSIFSIDKSSSSAIAAESSLSVLSSSGAPAISDEILPCTNSVVAIFVVLSVPELV